MPTYEYFCEECSVEFEEMFFNKTDSEKYQKSHPCPVCKNTVPRKISNFAFSFKGAVTGSSGINGNSGVHDWDYPTLDKAVARSSEKRWSDHRERQAAIDKVRKETNSHAVTMDNSGNIVPTEKSKLDVRTQAMPMAKKAINK